jgi:hypothetical protein
MTITLPKSRRKKFAADLRKHRETFPLNDAAYVSEVLRISLNTYKRCLESCDEPLSLKRQTFINLFTNTHLNPTDYGLTISLPISTTPYGGYDKRDYHYLCGRFLLYRRSFLTGENITRSVLEIHASETKECLSFDETHSYVSDRGIHDEHHYSGDIYIDRDRAILSLPAFRNGQVRLTLMHVPQRPIGREKVRIRGALLTFGIPRGYWQPTVSCVFAEGPLQDKSTSDRDLCAMIRADSDEYHWISAELAHVEEHATIMTPLLWRNLRKSRSSAA